MNTVIDPGSIRVVHDCAYALAWLIGIACVVTYGVLMIAAVGNRLTEAFWCAVTLPVSLRANRNKTRKMKGKRV